MLTDQNKAWMAGVIDLKGRLSAKQNATRKTRQHTWSVDSKEMIVVRRMCELTGTKPESRANRKLSEIFRRNCTEHCPEAHVHVDYEGLEMPHVLRWTSTGAGLVIVHTNLEPFLQVDRGYKEVVDEILEDPAVDHRGSASVLKSAARLQALGWSIPEPYASALEDRVLASLEEAA